MDDKAPAFLVYPKDFWDDEKVELMTNTEVGCYWRLLCKQWTEGSIPADIDKIAKLCKEDSSIMAQLWLAIGPCFIEDTSRPGRLVNPRMEKERRKMLERRTERAASGARGAKARWSKASEKHGDDGSANSSATQQPKANDAIAFAFSIPKEKDIEEAAEESGCESERADCMKYINRHFPHFVYAADKWRAFLEEWDGKVPWTVIKYAAEETMAAGANRFAYFESCLSDWYRAGCTTLEAVQAHQIRKKAAKAAAAQQKGGGQREITRATTGRNAITRADAPRSKWETQ